MARPKSPLTDAPETLPLTDQMLVFASSLGFDRAQAQWQAEQFLDKARAKGWQYADWTAAWRTWMRNVVEFRKSNPAFQSMTEPKHRKLLQ